MAFPYSIEKEITLKSKTYHLDQLPTNTLEIIKKTLLKKGFKRSEDFLWGHNSLFSIPFKLEINSKLDDKKLEINYKIVLTSFINLLLITNLLVAFLSDFKFKYYLWFIILVDIFLYALNYIIITNSIKNNITDIFRAYKKEVPTE